MADGTKEAKTLSVGERIKIARKNERYTQTQVAEILGISPRTFQNYESGASSMSEKLLREFSELCKVGYNWLITGEPSRAEKDSPAEGMNERVINALLDANEMIYSRVLSMLSVLQKIEDRLAEMNKSAKAR